MTALLSQIISRHVEVVAFHVKLDHPDALGVRDWETLSQVFVRPRFAGVRRMEFVVTNGDELHQGETIDIRFPWHPAYNSTDGRIATSKFAAIGVKILMGILGSVLWYTVATSSSAKHILE